MKIDRGISCLVTGASSGIGRAVAIQLGRRGARVALLARTEAALEEVAVEVRQAGGEALVVAADVQDADAVVAAVERTVGTFGDLRLLVANAGLGRYALVEDQPAEHVETTISINYVGMTRVVRAALPHLLTAAPSHVVGITSSAALIPHRLASAYCASKAASNAYLAALRLEVLDRGVGVSWVCPGVVDTPFVAKSELDPEVDLPRLARLLVRTLTPNEVAAATLKAVEHSRAEVVLPWTMRMFAMSRRIAPRFADWLHRVTG
jgi:short-subunit dehydrogenase